MSETKCPHKDLDWEGICMDCRRPAEVEAQGAGEPDEELYRMVRDFTAVGSRPKSEVRRRILAYAEQELDNLEKQFDTLAIQANDRIKATEEQLAKARERIAELESK